MRASFAGGKLPSATLGNPSASWLFALSPAAAVRLIYSRTIDLSHSRRWMSHPFLNEINFNDPTIEWNSISFNLFFRSVCLCADVPRIEQPIAMVFDLREFR